MRALMSTLSDSVAALWSCIAVVIMVCAPPSSAVSRLDSLLGSTATIKWLEPQDHEICFLEMIEG
jgi:hypothetical protein